MTDVGNMPVILMKRSSSECFAYKIYSFRIFFHFKSNQIYKSDSYTYMRSLTNALMAYKDALKQTVLINYHSIFIFNF